MNQIQKQTSSQAITVLILGILSFIGFGLITGIPAIYLGTKEFQAIKQGLSPEENRTMAMIGFILGIIGTFLSCILFCLFFFIGGNILTMILGTL